MRSERATSACRDALPRGSCTGRLALVERSRSSARQPALRSKSLALQALQHVCTCHHKMQPPPSRVAFCVTLMSIARLSDTRLCRPSNAKGGSYAEDKLVSTSWCTHVLRRSPANSFKAKKRNKEHRKLPSGPPVRRLLAVVRGFTPGRIPGRGSEHWCKVPGLHPDSSPAALLTMRVAKLLPA